MVNKILGLILLACMASGLYLSRPRDASVDLEVDVPNLEFGDVLDGSTHRIAIKIHNPNRKSMRVVGFTEGCSRNFCCWTVEALPYEIPAGEARIVTIELHPRNSGDLNPDGNIRELYLENPSGIHTVELVFKGRVIREEVRK
jgi:hypothetical protein